MGVLERRERENGVKEIFEKVIFMDFLKLRKDFNFRFNKLCKIYVG